MARETRGTTETRTDRVVLARHAGLSRVSLASVLAGTLVAYGAFAVLLAITAAVAESVGFDTNLSTTEWRSLGTAGGAVVAVVLLLCYLFGGYVAGRMARRSGATNGLMVFVLGVLVAGGVAALVNVFTDGDEIVRNLRNVGVPTSADEWRDIGTVAGIGSLIAMLLGSVMGGALGERWHTKLLTLAADPSVGPEAEARATADHHRRELQRAEERARENRLEPVDTEPRSVTGLPRHDDADAGGTLPDRDEHIAAPPAADRSASVEADGDVPPATHSARRRKAQIRS